jgi:hypothetical protein
MHLKPSSSKGPTFPKNFLHNKNIGIQHVFTFQKILLSYVFIIKVSLVNSRWFFGLLEEYPYKNCMRFCNLEIISWLKRICIAKLHLLHLGRCKLSWFTFVMKRCFFSWVSFIQMHMVINIYLVLLIGTWI